MLIDDLFTPAQQALAEGLHQRDQKERQAGSIDPLRLKAVSREVAHFLCLTAVQKQAQTLVEFGTSHGYSTLHLAAVAQRTGGRLYSLDNVAEKTAAAQANLVEAGFGHLVQCHTSTGRDFIDALPQQIDFVLVDFGLHSFAPLFPQLESRLAPGAFLFVDGWSTVEEWDADPDWAGFRQRLAKDPQYLVSILPLNKQHLIATRLP
ncbi:MAG: O-methyltransferase [Candidatus Latescibacteria bacterium]|nr:O-methyltransferase [Candidatus Latescibacterota bacterium]